jgi:Tol biopolymer transport system component
VTARADGSDVRVITPATEGVHDIDPKWSPDGSRIVFERDLPTGVQIVVIGADGRGARVIDTRCTAPCDSDQLPTWIPDGRHIVFTRVVGPFDGPNGSAASAVMWIADDDGTQVRRFSERGIDGVYEDYQAHWAPDRSYIQFLRIRNEPFNSAVFRLRPNGTGARQLTPWELDADVTDLSQARWGPTRDRVVFETYGHGGQAHNIATVPATCRTLARCTARIRYATSNAPDGRTFSANPAWSPDGARIAFAEWTEPAPGEPDTADWYSDIFTMDPRGHHRRLLSRGAEWSFRPNWAVAAHR